MNGFFPLNRLCNSGFLPLNPNKKIEQGRQRLFTQFSSVRGAIPNFDEPNVGRVILIFDNERGHYYNDVRKNRKKYCKLGIWWIYKV